MATEMATATDIEQLKAHAWAMARILGATFTDTCWRELSSEIHNGIGTPVPLKDQTAYNSDGPARRRLLEIRLARLVAYMLEEAFTEAPGPGLLVLHERYLRSVLGFKLCLWPFWIKDC